MKYAEIMESRELRPVEQLLFLHDAYGKKGYISRKKMIDIMLELHPELSREQVEELLVRIEANQVH